MALPRVSVQAAPGDAPVVTVDGNPIPGVRSAQITTGADRLPQVVLALAADHIDVELPAAVSVLRSGPSATDFAAQLNPAALESAALQQAQLASDVTQGEIFAAAVQALAADFDAQHHG